MLRLITTTPRRSRRSAFTLLEVLVVVSIIIVLVGLGTVYVFGYLENAKIDAAYTKAANIARSLDAYKSRFGQYPDSLDALVSPPNGIKAYCSPEELNDPWGKRYSFDPTGKNNNGLRPDVYTTGEDGQVIGNWGR